MQAHGPNALLNVGCGGSSDPSSVGQAQIQRFIPEGELPRMRR
jgi:hypothetical protein